MARDNCILILNLNLEFDEQLRFILHGNWHRNPDVDIVTVRCSREAIRGNLDRLADWLKENRHNDDELALVQAIYRCRELTGNKFVTAI